MNLYFLLEGKTEKIFHPYLIKFIAPHLTEVLKYSDVVQNNYYIFSNMGYPNILTKALPNAIEDVKLHNKSTSTPYEYLVYVCDTDEESSERRENEFYKTIPKNLNFKCKCFVQNRCIETWFLANKKIVKKRPENEMLNIYKSFYDISLKDPELMPLIAGEKNHADFHLKFLKKILQEHPQLSYSKNNPKYVCENTYIKEMVKRIKTSKHLQSLKNYIEFLESI